MFTWLIIRVDIYLDPVVVGVCNDDVVLSVDGNSGGLGELEELKTILIRMNTNYPKTEIQNSET